MSELVTATSNPQSSPSLCRNAPTATRPCSRKRNRYLDFADFNVHVDLDANHGLSTPPLKKSKKASRVPLSIRFDSTNISPAPSPLRPDTPFPFSPADPFWYNKENYERQACYETPTSTLDQPFRDQSPYSTPSPVPPPTPTSFPRHSTRTVTRPRPDSLPIRESAVKDVILYSLLGLHDCRASNREIRAAYRKTAMNHHPDRVDQEERYAATLRMQRVNAARDVLLDRVRRKAYHKTGKLPWTV